MNQMRTCKVGLDYFPLDVDFFEDEKIQCVSAKYDILGENVCIKLLQRIYRNGYYIHWGDDEALLFAKKVNPSATYEQINGIVQELLKRGFFSKTHFERYQILTSNGIQKRFLEATRRRKNAEIYNEYLIANIQGFNVNIIPLNDDISTQRKGKESKGKESREGTPDTPPLFGSFRNVKITEDEHQKLIKKFGSQEANDRIERLSEGIASKGYKYQSHYATILSWSRLDEKRGNGNGSKPGTPAATPDRPNTTETKTPTKCKNHPSCGSVGVIDPEAGLCGPCFRKANPPPAELAGLLGGMRGIPEKASSVVDRQRELRRQAEKLKPEPEPALE